MAGKHASMMRIRDRPAALPVVQGPPPVAEASAEESLAVIARLLCIKAGRVWLGMVDQDLGDGERGARRLVATTEGMAIIVLTARNAVLLEQVSEQQLAAIPNICA